MTHDSTELPATLLDVSNLIDAPGATRQVELDVPVPEGFEMPLTTMIGEVEVDGILESLVDGVLFRGSVTLEIQQQCALCLTTLDVTKARADVADLFSDPKSVDDPNDLEVGYEISKANDIDIDSMIRDALSVAIPAAARCRPDCAGLCPVCGINRNDESCNCEENVTDDRWAALGDLKLGGS